MATILIVDDERSIRDSLEMILTYEKYSVVKAGSGKEALHILEKTPEIDIAILDVKMPGMDGIELLQAIKKLCPDVNIVMISGHADIQLAVEATKKGAYDFLEKPLDNDRILITIANALSTKKLSSAYRELKRSVSRERQMIGESPAIVEIFKTIERVAPTQARVLISGENGTGKELVARSIHENSKMSDGAFVEVNCAAIPENLIESELFGHEKGAFTHAHERRKGKFEEANQGTIFLDEIGDMSLSAQAKVLRVLEENKVTRVGGNSSIEVSVRILAASNKNLAEESNAGRFREDLFYRLNVVPIHVPPLRDRLADIPLLAAHFLIHFSRKYNMATKKITPEAIRELQAYHWPGNVRELKNVTERLVILINGETIELEEVRRYLSPQSPHLGVLFNSYETFEDFKRESEKIFLLQKLNETNWNIKKTSEILQMQRSNLYKKMEKYGLTKPGQTDLDPDDE